MSEPDDPGRLPVPAEPPMDVGGLAVPAPEGGSAWALDLASATLRLEGGEAEELLDSLGAKLERVLGRRAVVERQGGLRRRHHVGRITVDLDGERLEAVAGRQGPTFLAVHAVRGVTLKTTEIDADDWIARLVNLVSRQAERSTSVREALGGLLGP